MAQLDEPPELDPLRIVPTVFTANGDEIPSTVGQRVEDKVQVQREIGVTVPSGIRDLVRKLRDTNDQHNRIETTEIPDWWKKQKEKITDYFNEIQDAVNALYGLIGAPDFYPILGVSYFGGFAAPRDTVNSDLEWLCAHRWKSLRVGAVWDPAQGGGICNADGDLIGANVSNAHYLISLAHNLHMSVDLTIFAAWINSQGALEKALESIGREFRDYKYCFVDACNEHSGPSGPISPSNLKAALDALAAGDSARAVTASTSGSISGQVSTYLADYHAGCRFTFHTPHGERSPDWDTALGGRLNEFAQGVAAGGVALRAHAQEESRYGKPSTTATQVANFLASIENARAGGAIGWNFHTDAGYDLRGASLKDQCNAVETEVVETGLDSWVDP